MSSNTNLGNLLGQPGQQPQQQYPQPQAPQAPQGPPPQQYQQAPQYPQPQAPPQQQFQPQAPPPQYAVQQAPPQQPAQHWNPAQPQAPQYPDQAMQQAPPQQPQYAVQQAPPQQAPQPPQPQGGVFSRYGGAAQGIFKDRQNFGPKIYPDCEATYIVKLKRLSAGISKNKAGNAGKPFFAGNFEVLAVLNKGRNGDTSMIGVGTPISYHTWLPLNPSPEFMSVGDELNLLEALSLMSAILGLKPSDPEGNAYLDLSMADQMTIDDGAVVADRIFGVDYIGSPPKVPDPQNPNFMFYNPSFFCVDPATGQRLPGMTPQELQAANAQRG